MLLNLLMVVGSFIFVVLLWSAMKLLYNWSNMMPKPHKRKPKPPPRPGY